MFYLQTYEYTQTLYEHSIWCTTHHTHKSVSWCVQAATEALVRCATAAAAAAAAGCADAQWTFQYSYSYINTYIYSIHAYICGEFMYTLTLHKHTQNVQENTQTPVYPVYASDSVSNQPVLQHLCNGTLSVGPVCIYIYMCIHVWNAAIVVVVDGGGVVLLIAELCDPQPFSPAHKTKRADKRGTLAVEKVMPRKRGRYTLNRCHRRVS